MWGRNSSAGIATHYGLDGPGSNPGGGEIFRTRPDRPWGPTSLLSFLAVKRPERGVDHPPLLMRRLKKELRYTSTSPLGLRGMFYGELNLLLSDNK